MFYLRLEPNEKTYMVGYEKKTVMTDDRAVYKHQNFSRFYRGSFTGIKNKYQGMKVYTCKTLETIMQLRQNTFDYSGEWFDVYDKNGKVDISNFVRCKKAMVIEKCDDNGFFIPNKYMTVKEGSIWSIDSSPSRIAGGEIRLENGKGNWIEIFKDHFVEHFQKVC